RRSAFPAPCRPSIPSTRSGHHNRILFRPVFGSGVLTGGRLLGAVVPKVVTAAGARPSRTFRHRRFATVPVPGRTEGFAAQPVEPGGLSAETTSSGSTACAPPSLPAAPGNVPTPTPAITKAAPASASTLGRSESTSHAAAIPTTGTSIENGATIPAGYRLSSAVQIPEPATVPNSTM